MESRTKQKRSSRSNILLYILTVVLTLGFAGIYTISRSAGNEAIYQGIYIDGKAVGGMVKEEAISVLTNHSRDKLNKTLIALKYDGMEWNYGYDVVNPRLNIEETVEQAYSIGREGNFLNRFKIVRSLKKEPIELFTKVEYDRQGIEEKLNIAAGQIDHEPVDAKLTFYPDRYEKFEITPEQDGLRLDVAKVLEEIDRQIEAGNMSFELELKPTAIPARIARKDFTGKTEKLVTFGTDLSTSSEDRTHNVVKAAMEFNGMVVKPGQVVSFNGTTGERSLERGYRYAPMIKADKSLEDAPGGGASQTSTTLYNAVLRAGLEIVEFTRHSFPSAYIDKGLDTTVNLPSPPIDLKFRNNKTSPIYIRAFYASQRIYFEIYGEPLPDQQEIRIRTEEYETVPAPEPEYVLDEAGEYVTYEDEEFEKVKSREGCKVRVYREIYKGSELIESTLIDDHYYRPIKGIIYKGVQKRQDPLINIPLDINDTGDGGSKGGNDNIQMEIISVIE